MQGSSAKRDNQESEDAYRTDDGHVDNKRLHGSAMRMIGLGTIGDASRCVRAAIDRQTFGSKCAADPAITFHETC